MSQYKCNNATQNFKILTYLSQYKCNRKGHNITISVLMNYATYLS
jgi:hypothetical protein